MTPDPKTPMDEAREALAALDEFTTARDEARDAAYRDYWTSKIDNADARDPDHLRATLAEVDRLTAENGRLREALTALGKALTERDKWRTYCEGARESVAALTAERDAYKRAKAENDERFMLERDQARRERDEARQQLAEALAMVARAADTGDCRTCKWADAVVCHNPEGKRKNSPVWTWCEHALAEDLVTRLGTSPPCPGYTRKES